MSHYLAIDLGAESGRLMLGTLHEEKLSLKEVYRFPNSMLCLRNKYYWNIGYIYSEIIKGIEKCVGEENIQPKSIGIDTWGVDYGLLAKDGTLMGMPFAYRDSRTVNATEEFTELIPAFDLYKITGTLLAPYNTIFQLFAAKKFHPELLNSAQDLLFIPDLISYFLTGEKKTELSFATTSQLFNPVKKEWDKKIFDVLGIPLDIMQPVIEPGSVIGFTGNDISTKTGLNKIPVIAVATHDTNSAVTAIPASEKELWAFISSGTWSLMGFENPYPIISETTYSQNFSNEGGINSFHVLKNHMGLWLLQQCKACWKDKDYSYGELTQLAEKANSFSSFIDVDDNAFLNPSDMASEIALYLKRTNQEIPAEKGQLVRVILESLAMKYRNTIEQIDNLRKARTETIYITGGGINNMQLCQFTANATGRIVKTGLSEGTAAGNILVQALSLGELKSVKELRKTMSKSCDLKTYYPEKTELWEAAYQKYKKIVK